MIKSSELLKKLQTGSGYDWRTRDISISGVKMNEEVNSLEINLSQMYEYPEFTFEFLAEISEFLSTKNINIGNQYSNSGCETCDWGSSYSLTLYIKDCEITLIDQLSSK